VPSRTPSLGQVPIGVGRAAAAAGSRRATGDFSSERDDDREGALRLGATWFVCKPIEGVRFRAEVQQLGDRWARTVA
jgi:hypothetical protein